MTDSIQARILSQLEKNPDARALSFYSSDGEFRWATRAELFREASRYAHYLAGEGVQKGDVCLIVLPSEEYAALMLLGVLLAGGIPLLIAPPVLQEKEAFSSLLDILKGVIGKTNPRVVIGAESMAAHRQELEALSSAPRFIFGGKPADGAGFDRFEARLPSPEEVAAMQLTSGTTGVPRICVWRQRNVLAALDGMWQAMSLREDDVCLNWTPLYHDMGLVNNFLLCLTSGIPLVMLRPQDFVRKPGLWLRGLHDTGATVTWSPNFGFAIAAQRVRDSELKGVRLDHVRGFWNAAERIHYETLVAFERRFGPYGVRPEALRTNFGCAENIGGATFTAPGERFQFEHVDRARLQEERVAQVVAAGGEAGEVVTVVGVGQPFPGMEINILSEEGAPLPEGRVGEIALKTPSRMEGYLDDEGSNQYALFGDYLRTGDLGYLRGRELFWVGRVRERITIRGKKIDPSDFEPILFQVPGLRHGNFAAFGVDDEGQGTQRIVLVAEVRDGNHYSVDEILGDIRNQVWMRLGINVSEIVLVRAGTLTKTSSGKRRHRYFRDLYLAGQLQAFAVA